MHQHTLSRLLGSLALTAALLTVGCSDDDATGEAGQVELDGGDTTGGADSGATGGEDTGAADDSGAPEDTSSPDTGAADTDTPDTPEDPNQIRVRFEPSGAGFHSTPWPSDARVTEEGTPYLGDFPGQDTLLKVYMDAIERSVQGFANMPIIYFGLDGAAATEASLPDAVASTAVDSPVQLIDVSPAGCGARVPVGALINDEGDTFSEAGVLQVANSIGTRLEPGRPYAAVLLTSFGAPDGLQTARPEGFGAVLDGTDADDPWARSLQPLRDCLPMTDLDADTIAVATVFTPQDPVAELQRLRDVVMDPEQTETRGLTLWERSEAWSRRSQRIETWVGEAPMPVFQDGAIPYDGEGGRLLFDDAGTPQVQRWEDVPVAASWRTFEEPFEGPRPVLVFIDGTGWSPWTHLRSAWSQDALNEGYVIFSFMPQFHGNRAGFGGSPEISTFNILNPDAGRTNFRQQAAETSYFIRIIREQMDGQEGLPEVNTDTIVYGGHSQGALAGALTAAVESEYAAYVFNGLSSYLTLTILFRDDIIDFAGLIGGVFGINRDLNRFHPVLQLMQLGTEAVDPHNFAPLWRGWEGSQRGNHVFVVNGLEDSTTTKRGIDHLTMTGDLPVLAPAGWEVDEESIWETPEALMPVQGNATSVDGEPLTIATYLQEDQGHFTIYRLSRVRDLALRFWRTARESEDGVPALHFSREQNCGDTADDDTDGLIDCEDPDCEGRPPCIETACDDGEDNDGNGVMDCEDPACARRNPCIEAVCDDDMDHDGDGLVDCDDPDCDGRAPCGEGSCDDGVDGDMNGMTDCEDPACVGTDACLERCSDGEDNDLDGAEDCDDPDCFTSRLCPEVACEDEEDNNSDGLFDCADPGCLFTEACPVELEMSCADDADTDGDGLAGCDDPDCALDAACADDGLCADADLGDALGTPLLVGTLEEMGDDVPPSECIRLGNGGDSQDVAFRWTAPSTGRFFISTYGSEADTVLSLYPDGCDYTREFGCDDDDGPIESSRILLEIDEGVSITIAISGYGEQDVGPFQLHIYPLPAE